MRLNKCNNPFPPNQLLAMRKYSHKRKTISPQTCVTIGIGIFIYYLLIPVSSTSKRTLNPIQRQYYETKGNRDNESAIIKLCYHYAMGNHRDIEKAQFWAQKLSKIESSNAKGMSDIFSQQIDHQKQKAIQSIEPIETTLGD